MSRIPQRCTNSNHWLRHTPCRHHSPGKRRPPIHFTKRRRCCLYISREPNLDKATRCPFERKCCSGITLRVSAQCKFHVRAIGPNKLAADHAHEYGRRQRSNPSRHNCRSRLQIDGPFLLDSNCSRCERHVRCDFQGFLSRNLCCHGLYLLQRL